MPRLAEYRWLRGFCTASASFSTAMSGDGMSGLPKPRSTTSSPARRASIFNASITPNTYGGSELILRNSTGSRYQRARRHFRLVHDRYDELAQHRGVLGVGGVDRAGD